MTPDDLADIEKGLHSPAMQCGHCTLVRRLLAEAEGITMRHVEYGVLITSPKGHRYQDSTHRTSTRAEEIVDYRNSHPGHFPGETAVVVQRKVTYTLGEWEPVS